MFADDAYPQASKLAAASSDRSTVADFLEWCSEQGYHLAKHGDGAELSASRLYVIPQTHDAVVMDYLGIDTIALERERRAMLDGLGGK